VVKGEQVVDKKLFFNQGKQWERKNDKKEEREYTKLKTKKFKGGKGPKVQLL